MSIQLRYAAFSDVGLVRKSNQDGGYASPHLLVLADGMGGAAGGDIASSVTVAHLAEIDDVHQADELLPTLRRALTDAHEELIERAGEKEELAGLGTTCIAILRTSNKLAMVHIGDSRAYLLRGGKLTQVTKDHTLVQYLVDTGQITPEEAENHPKRNVIMRAIGDSPGPLELDESIREAVPGDRWLLCSDGLFGVVSKSTIEATLVEYENLDEAGERLIELALAAGAPDNVTVVLAEVVDSETAGPSDDRGPIVVGSAAVDYSRPSRGGNSAAGKAAALSTSAASPETPADDEENSAQPRRLWARIAATIAIIALVIAGAAGGYAWTQTRYFVSVDNGQVAIYQGIPQHLGPISFSSVHEITSLEVSDLSPVAQQRLSRPITRSSLSAAREVVDDLENQIRIESPPPSPSPSSTPSASPGTDPSPTPDSSPGTSPGATDSPAAMPPPNSTTPSPNSTRQGGN